MTHCNEIIDLTDSFSLATHRSMANLIIELDTDDSFSCNDYDRRSTADYSATETWKCERNSLQIETSKNQKSKLHQKTKITTKSNSRSPRSSWGECPICWDELGRNPLASTKCGHVFCMKCLERSLKVERKCPTCRHALKGSSAYHPLYLN